MNKLTAIGFTILAACSSGQKEPPYGYIERLDDELNTVISNQASIDIIADSLDWSEGPLWLEKEQKLIFSDVPRNTIYSWTEELGKQVYLTPSGYTGTAVLSQEPGSNGLALDKNGSLLLCQHGDRRVARMEASVSAPAANFISLTDRYADKRYNSPNDLTIHSSGAIFFTDPPYGLPEKTIGKELSYQGVYVINDKRSILLIDSLSFPNGIALSPDEKKLYVAVSDPKKARWYEYTLTDSLTIASGKIFYDATTDVPSQKGLPDGLKVDQQGNIFATGPGGVWIFNANGKLLGKIRLPEATSNCALSADEKTLFITNDMYVVKVTLR